jgi:hypothetical protein
LNRKNRIPDADRSHSSERFGDKAAKPIVALARVKRGERQNMKNPAESAGCIPLRLPKDRRKW